MTRKEKATIPEINFCPDCGLKVDSEDWFCQNCGKGLN
jgi:membrane protease subunit (stomatin/prohibitin family)